jgi:hypothetical protein
MQPIKADFYDALLAVHNHFEKPADLKLRRLAITKVEKALKRAEDGK